MSKPMTVNYDCRCGDVITFPDATGNWTVRSTWPNGCRLVNGVDEVDVTYARLRDLEAVYVQEAPAPPLPECSGLH